jgi:putative ABC transport system permease protein
MPHDLRSAIRALARTPGVTTVIVVSLALGTGANAAVYSAVDALLVRGPAGVRSPSTLVDVYTSQITGASYGDSSYPDFLSIAAATTGLERVEAIEDRDEVPVRDGTNAGLARVAAVAPGFWDLLGLQQAAGDWRRPGVVLSTNLWEVLGRDPAIIGKSIAIDGRAYPVVAIAPPRFRGLHLDRVFDAWVPLDASGDRGRGDRRLRLLGRLQPGASIEGVQARLDALAADLARTHPATNVGTVHSPDEPRRLTVLRYSRVDPAARGRASLLGAILLGATALLLLSACVNAGSLLLSRGLARRTELTIKTALGADRGRLVRAFLIESVLLALAGAAAGVAAASWTAGAIPALFAPDHASLLDTHVERGVMMATFAVGAIAGVIFGLIPALASTRALAPDGLRGDASRLGEAPGAARLRMGLVASQLAFSTVFLVGSVLLSRAVDSALQFDESSAEGSLAVASVEPLDGAYLGAATAGLKRIPTVDVVGLVATPPEARAVQRLFLIERAATREPVEIDINYASADYFRVVHDPILEGRVFSRQDDTDDADPVIVNEALAQRYFADRAIGRTLTDFTGHAVRIIGVARTHSYRALEGPPRPTLFFPMTRYTARAFCAIVRLRSYVDARSQVGLLKAELERTGPTRTLNVRTFRDHLSRALAADRLTGVLIAACGLLALALAVVGVYGVMADLVRRRTREIGLRLALGAGPLHIVRGIVGASVAPAFAGIAAGIGGAALLARIGRTFVFEVPSADLPTLVLTMAGLAVVVAAAIAPSALRALRVSPLTALRDP